jgi:hypothetical protein
MQALMDAIYKARPRQKGSDAGLASQYAPNIDQLKALCEKHQHDVHAKLGEVAREFLLDWEVIIRQVSEPDLPLTSNEPNVRYGTGSLHGASTMAHEGRRVLALMPFWPSWLTLAAPARHHHGNTLLQ